MYKLTGFTSDPYQTITFSLSNGETVIMSFFWIDNYFTWYINVETEKWKINGIRLCQSYSLLRNYRYRDIDIVCLMPKDITTITKSSLGREVILYVYWKNKFEIVDEIQSKLQDKNYSPES